MTFAISFAGAYCSQACNTCVKKVPGMPVTQLVTDLFLLVSCVVLGVLALKGILPMQPAAAYGFFGAAGAILIADIATVGIAICKNKKDQDAESKLK